MPTSFKRQCFPDISNRELWVKIIACLNLKNAIPSNDLSIIFEVDKNDIDVLAKQKGDTDTDYVSRLIDAGFNVGEVSCALDMDQRTVFAIAYRSGKFNNIKFNEIKRITRFNSIQMDCEL